MLSFSKYLATSIFGEIILIKKFKLVLFIFSLFLIIKEPQKKFNINNTDAKAKKYNFVILLQLNKIIVGTKKKVTLNKLNE